MKQCTLDTNIITAFLKNDLRVVERVSNYLEHFDKLTIKLKEVFWSFIISSKQDH